MGRLGLHGASHAGNPPRTHAKTTMGTTQTLSCAALPVPTMGATPTALGRDMSPIAWSRLCEDITRRLPSATPPRMPQRPFAASPRTPSELTWPSYAGWQGSRACGRGTASAALNAYLVHIVWSTNSNGGLKQVLAVVHFLEQLQ